MLSTKILNVTNSINLSEFVENITNILSSYDAIYLSDFDIHKYINWIGSNTRCKMIFNDEYVSINSEIFKITVSKEQASILIKDDKIYFNHYETINKQIFDFLDVHPLLSSENIIEVLKEEALNENSSISTLSNSVFVPIGIREEDITNILSLLNDDIIGYFSILENDFVDFDGNIIETDKYNNIYIINNFTPEWDSSVLKDRYINKNFIYLGNFRGITQRTDSVSFDDLHEESLIKSKTPIIMISSLGSNMSKFVVQTTLQKAFNNDGIDSQCITYNPLGAILKNTIFLNYNTNVEMKVNVKNIQSLIQFLDKQKENDAIIINVGGGVSHIDNLNNDYGFLTYSYLCALNIDVAILCINIQLTLEKILSEIAYLKSRGIAKVFLVISDNIYIKNLQPNTDFFNYYTCVDNNCFEDCKKVLSKYEETFTLRDVKNNKLYNRIYEIFTNH